MKRISTLLSLAFTVFVALFYSGTAHASHKDITCQRTTLSTQGFAQKSHAESWFPEQLRFSNRKFKHVSDNLKLLRYTKSVTTTDGNSYSKFHYLFPDGRLSVSISDRGGYKGTGASYYKCNKTALEVRQEKLNPSH